jgi:hypothetical protein
VKDNKGQKNKINVIKGDGSMQKITIKPAVNGWMVIIGYSTFVAVDKEHMLNEIGRYIDNPKEVEKEYMENAKNKDEHPRLPEYQEERPRLEAERPLSSVSINEV